MLKRTDIKRMVRQLKGNDYFAKEMYLAQRQLMKLYKINKIVSK